MVEKRRINSLAWIMMRRNFLAQKKSANMRKIKERFPKYLLPADHRGTPPMPGIDRSGRRSSYTLGPYTFCTVDIWDMYFRFCNSGFLLLAEAVGRIRNP